MKFDELNSQQVGTYAEYYVKMEMTKYGLSVFTAEVDDRGVDFVARVDAHGKVRHYDVQVKSLRSKSFYIYIPETKFRVSENFLIAIALFRGEVDVPELYLIPSTAWSKPNDLLGFKDYESRGLKSKNEYSINISQKNQVLLEVYRFNKTLEQL